MASITKVVYSHFHNRTHLMIGICFGLSLSFLFAPNTEDYCYDCAKPLPYSPPAHSLVDEYEPRIIDDRKNWKAHKEPKAFVRPRYYSTELGIREKLFVGVVTSHEHLHTRAVALNKTLAHVVDKVRYFISITEGAKPNVTLPGIVGFTDTRGISKLFHVIKFITDSSLEDYDYYYIVKDSCYINGRRLLELAEHMSVSYDVHLGVNVPGEKYCSIDAGILLSNSVVRKLKTSLDWCVKNTFSSSDDVDFGRCVLHATNVSCTSEIADSRFHALRLPTMFDFDENFEKLMEKQGSASPISVYPIYDHRIVYKINAYYASTELRRVSREISKLRELILQSSHLAPESDREVSWPVGNQPGNRSTNRFEFLSWIYFNETHSFMDRTSENVRQSVGSAKEDLRIVLRSAAKKIESEYAGELVYQRLINGYRKFDASRGMDYILDMEFARKDGRRIMKRIEVCKPLSKVEILPVPYVTENSGINMILVIDSLRHNRADCRDFLVRYENACMKTKQRTFLLLVLLYEPGAASKGTNDTYRDVKQQALNLTEMYKKSRSEVTWLSIRLPHPSSEIRDDPMLKIALADLVTRKFSTDTLLLFVEPEMDLKIEYLNRVRMNTINNWQIYSPIPFVGFNPDVAQQPGYTSKQPPGDLDVHRNVGRYEDLNYETLSFYVKDYNAMRRQSIPEIPQVRADKDIPSILALSHRNIVDSLFELFVKFSDVHALRAVEPALKIRYTDFNCNATYSEMARKLCERRRHLRLGDRAQLAKLIMDYDEGR